jgi:hypothetical protein
MASISKSAQTVDVSELLVDFGEMFKISRRFRSDNETLNQKWTPRQNVTVGNFFAKTQTLRVDVGKKRTDPSCAPPLNVQPIPAFRVCSHTHTRLPKTQKDRDLDR